ncbi:MAG: protein-methionine-sulfoxide reductase heme-binding subunit MsrQ [Paracoccaceae bacterium]|jgi:sulfoxide reductase heme-binding subunit YedZ|nr:protein-methionine-sulfoxide reductase heme-binding subunit MsrQ [Paracoccaceae bacterium]
MTPLVDSLNARLRRWPDWPLYVLGVIPVIWIYWRGITGQLGVDPVKVIEHRLGLWALWLLLAGLAISPLANWTGLRLVKFRRAVGLLAFFYVLVHLLTWLVLDVQILAQVWADILKRPYITIGMAGFVLMIPLAATSNNWSIRRLGAAGWQRLHRLTYAVVLLGALHYVMLAKGFQLEPLIYLGVAVGLVALRLRPRRRPRPRPA